MCSASAETSPLAFGEWEVDRGFELEEREGLEELEATEKASRAGFASALKSAPYEVGPAIARLRSAK